ncbi:MAG TPA: hypothetical protein VMM92_06480, partial [Thermoanaerobaculia bacterium]|nr:hypothetical protein [Thermoanaerobaculia bacterium]
HVKKLILGSLFLMLGLGVFAQAGTGYFDILVGGQFSTGNYQYSNYFVYNNALYQWRVNGSGRNNFLGSLDGGYFFTENIGLHFAYLYDAGKFQANFHAGSLYAGSYNFNKDINIGEIGPEFAWKGGGNSQSFLQLNVGYTFGNSTPNVNTVYGSMPLGNFGKQTFVYGAALGYRYYFSQMTGMTIQTAYHHFQDYAISDIWDVRVGVSFRFK